MNVARFRSRGGFTLVELLVVLAIIGVLVAILVPAVYVVRRQAIVGAIGLEVKGLENAVEAYKNETGDYPPNFNDAAIIKRHIMKRWQRLPAAQQTAFNNLVGKLDPDEALVFWLGGQSPSGGLMANDVLPLNTTALASRKGEPKKFFEFDTGRLVDNDNDGWYEYRSSSCQNATYIYFDSRSYLTYTSSAPVSRTIDGIARGSGKPYAKQASPTLQTHFVNPDTYQILAAGMDGLHGDGGKVFPDGPYVAAERDNLANFTEGKTLQDKAP